MRRAQPQPLRNPYPAAQHNLQRRSDRHARGDIQAGAVWGIIADCLHARPTLGANKSCHAVFAFTCRARKACRGRHKRVRVGFGER